MEEMNVYEEQVNETEEMIPVEADAEEEAGMSNGAAFALGSLATAGAIWLGNKLVKFVKGRRAKKAAEAIEAEIEEVLAEEEPAPENAEA